MDAETFFPLREGRGFEYHSQRVNFTASLKFEAKDADHWVMTFRRQNGLRDVWLLLRDANGIRLSLVGGKAAALIDPPLLLVPKVVTEGIPWTSTGSLMLPGETKPDPNAPVIRLSLESSGEMMEVHCGDRQYRAVKVELSRRNDLEPNPPKAGKTRLWIAPTVGIVKWEVMELTSDPSVHTTLESWELAETKG
jgi:hypothetical protein